MRKKFLGGAVKALDSDDPNGSFEVVLSAPTLDRDGEVIDAKAFDPLPDHITFDIDHGMTVTTTVGSGRPTYEGDMLVVRGTYASTPLAQEVRTLVTEGHIRSTSVAFMDAKREVKDGVPHITKAELLNGAFVCIPSNRQAAVMSSKSATAAERRALDGSFEARRDQLRMALAEQHPEAWFVNVLGTFDDHVVYELEGPETATLRAVYEITGEGLSIGTPEPVEVTETVTPKKSTDADPDDKAAAPAAADRPAEVYVALAEAEAALVDVRIRQGLPAPAQVRQLEG